MTLRLVILIAMLGASVAHADDHKPVPPMQKVRELYSKGDYEGVRRELLRLYELEPAPQLLFALGQVELNLGNYQAAINYYEEFIATGPSAEQVALAQQAIGAARLRLSEPPRDTKPPPPDPEPMEIVETPEPRPAKPRWTLTHSGLVAFGGAAVLLGGGLLYYSHRLGNDMSGNLSNFDSRLDQARSTRMTGAGIAAAGTLLIGVTLLW